VNIINEHIHNQLPGPAVSYKSIDIVVQEDQVVQYPIQFLHSLEPSGVPPHNLVLNLEHR